MNEKARTTVQRIRSLLTQTFTNWKEDRCPRLGAALAYYSVFSLPPLLLIIIAIAGVVFGAEVVRGEILHEIAGLVGTDGAQVVESMLAGAQKQSSGIIAAAIGTVVLLFGASGVFGELQDSLNTVWEVPQKEGGGIWQAIKDRFFSFTMVLGLGFLFLVSLVVSTAITAMQSAMANVIPGPDIALSVVNFAVSFSITAFLFALLFKYIPDAEITWRSVWIGAVVTALLFVLGKYGIGVYLGKSNLATSYGAAGSVIIVLVWIYYAAQILLFGAEFTQVYAESIGDFRVAESGERQGEEAAPRREAHTQPAPALPSPIRPFSATIHPQPLTPRERARERGGVVAVMAVAAGCYIAARTKEALTPRRVRRA